MFTSRAEYRLLLRQGNADLRLSDAGFKIGLLSKRNHDLFVQKRQAIEKELDRLRQTRSGPDTLELILSRPGTVYADLPERDDTLSSEVIQQVEIAIKYAGYIDRQDVEVAKFKTLEDKQIPAGFDYDTVPSLRREGRQKLKTIRPATLGQASRISGITPAAISLLLIYHKKGFPLIKD